MQIQTFTGNAVARHLDAVAAMRIAVFRDWPYCYDGDVAYEAQYLATYAQSPESLFVLVFDGDAVVGASTALPLADETETFQRPFREKGIAPGDVFYFGESVLLPAYRGRGLGHTFFDRREGWAHELGRFRQSAFCAVERRPDDPRRPPDYRGNELFWRKRGYVPQDDLFCELEWREVGQPEPMPHALRFWLHDLRSER
ncbi:GNAT family N-acetyltransferase [Tahibacter amnicola]|uniref:GNAT family N-acetyltransferase n=1 Tax=Tahibacter amnicola TaxID=2976241 RepID=A0ABY6BI73_9GAMM|nr:GNAT family N-acetyltransferase [Tahibacter amnicola]UXI69569.1 GNAT family N-acetyltransferase [Tahibacter amnicola]